jgi:hypothetical protein
MVFARPSSGIARRTSPFRACLSSNRHPRSAIRGPNRIRVIAGRGPGSRIPDPDPTHPWNHRCRLRKPRRVDSGRVRAIARNRCCRSHPPVDCTFPHCSRNPSAFCNLQPRAGRAHPAAALPCPTCPGRIHPWRAATTASGRDIKRPRGFCGRQTRLPPSPRYPHVLAYARRAACHVRIRRL